MSMEKITPDSPEVQSANLVAENIEKLKVLFPVDELCADLLTVEKEDEALLENILGDRN